MSHVKLTIGQELPDPFIFPQPEGYYLTGSDMTRGDEDKFDLFFSRDLVHWKKTGRLLILPDYSGSDKGNFWAPEIVQIRNKFCMYYTADADGDPEKRYVRAAVGERVEGPYHDIGILTEEPSIDGHPFFDKTGRMYLIYTGNEGSAFKGQLAIETFANPNRLDGKPRKIFPEETVEWEEGAFTLKYKEKVMLFSSMGNWRDESYHVGVSLAQTPETPFARLTADGKPYRLLESSDDRTGPGHCSLFRAPGREVFICYHAWDKGKKGRYPWMAPLTFRNDIPVVE
jgi:beta-xylosidase